MIYGELFAGIGGMSLGLERAGHTSAWFAEVDAFCSRVLAHHWPSVPNLGDVTLIDWTAVPPVDLLVAGFPCQPFSQAGNQKGADDERYLWPEVLRAVRGLGPRVVLLENVPALVAMREFGAILGDLADCGYDAEWDCVPAAAVGAPHLRYRVFVVAYPQSEFSDGRDDHARISVGSQSVSELGNDGGTTYVAYPQSVGQSRSLSTGSSRIFGTLPERCSGGTHWTVEPDVGRVAHGIPRRVDRLRSLGNAVVPQVAEWLGRRLMEVFE